MKKIRIYQELVYAAAIVILSLAVAMISSTDFGVSMIVAPAYILSQKLSFLTFGQSEYIIQALLFVLFCVVMRKVRAVYLTSFVTSILYGAVLDFWRWIIPHFNPEITPPGSLPLALRIVYFVLGMLLTSFAVSLFFRTYLYPQVYDFFVKCVSAKYAVPTGTFKTGFDLSMLAVSCVLSLALFRRFVGIGAGTLIMACVNGTLISLFGKGLDRIFSFVPAIPKACRYFSETD